MARSLACVRSWQWRPGNGKRCLETGAELRRPYHSSSDGRVPCDDAVPTSEVLGIEWHIILYARGARHMLRTDMVATSDAAHAGCNSRAVGCGRRRRCRDGVNMGHDPGKEEF